MNDIKKIRERALAAGWKYTGLTTTVGDLSPRMWEPPENMAFPGGGPGLVSETHLEKYLNLGVDVSDVEVQEQK